MNGTQRGHCSAECIDGHIIELTLEHHININTEHTSSKFLILYEQLKNYCVYSINDCL